MAVLSVKQGQAMRPASTLAPRGTSDHARAITLPFVKVKIRGT